MKSLKFSLNTEFGKIGEECFITEVTPLLHDKVACRLGEVWGKEYNEYLLTESDFEIVSNWVDKQLELI